MLLLGGIADVPKRFLERFLDVDGRSGLGNLADVPLLCALPRLVGELELISL